MSLILTFIKTCDGDSWVWDGCLSWVPYEEENIETTTPTSLIPAKR